MSLADVMSAMRLHLFAEAAFVLASASFLTVLVTVFLRRNRGPFERARWMPLQDDEGPRPVDPVRPPLPREEALRDE
jgi:cbb3-type cytochrome oxidase subunit 3